jgi:hypothetical protein
VQAARRAPEYERDEPGADRGRADNDAERGREGDGRQSQHEAQQRHEPRLPLPFGNLDCERMLERPQRIGIAAGDEVDPGEHLAGVANERGEEAVQALRHAAEQQREQPHEWKDDHGEHRPDSEHDVLRHEDERAKEDGEPAPLQRFVVVYTQPALVHLSRYRTRVRRVVLLLLAVLVLGGCGGGGDGGRLTKQEYAAEADEICAKFKEETAALESPSDLSGLANAADKTLEILDKALGELRKLNPPVSEQAKADEWIAAVEQLKGDLAEIRDKAKGNDLQAVQAVVPRASQHNSRANQLATELGMTVCNKD